MKRIEKVRLYPTPAQGARLNHVLHVLRQLYNALLQERRDAYRLRGMTVTTEMQYAELTELRRYDPRIAAIYRECEDAVLHRLDLAMSAFFRRLARRESPGHPRFKSAGRFEQIGFPHGDRALKLDERQRRVRVPGVGNIRLRKGRLVSAFGRAWLVRKNGRWYCCFECDREAQPMPPTGRVIGVDRGVHVLAATSEGRLHRNARIAERHERVIAKHQRTLEAVTLRDSLGRCRNGQDPWRLRVRQLLSRAKEREANARRDALHKLARRIVAGADTVVLEKLDLRSMTRSAKGSLGRPGRNVRAKAGLNRALLDAGFGLLRQMIVSKAEEAGRAVVEVDGRYSSQECSRCGHVAAKSRRRRRFVCVGCGFRCHADVNAASVIRGRAQYGAQSELSPVSSRFRTHDAA